MKWILILVTVLYSGFSYSSVPKQAFSCMAVSGGQRYVVSSHNACIPHAEQFFKSSYPQFTPDKTTVSQSGSQYNFTVHYQGYHGPLFARTAYGNYFNGCPPDYPNDNGDGTCSGDNPPEPPEPPPPPENKCKVPAGEILARRSGIEGANGRYYCVKQCSGIAKQVGDMCISVGDGPNICDYELISSGVDCDGNGDGSTDGDGSGNPPPPPEPIPPETGDGSNDNGDGSLEPDINGDGSGGSGDINGDGTINGADYGGNLAKIVENTAKTAVAVNTNTNMITDAINKQTKAITDAVNNGNGSGNGSGTPDGDGDGEADSVNGGSCEQFVCNGPAVQCYIAQKQWEQKCDIEGVIAQNEKPVIDGINTFINDNPITNIEAGTLDISTYFNKYDGSNGIQTGGSCPAPISISLGEYGSHTVKLDPLCELAVIIRVFLQITAVVSVGLMFAKYS